MIYELVLKFSQNNLFQRVVCLFLSIWVYAIARELDLAKDLHAYVCG